MNKREQALKQIAALARTHGVSEQEIHEALSAAPSVDDSPQGSIVARLFAYLGGIFIFSGIAAFVGMFWVTMNSFMHVLITLGTGVACFVMALTFLRDGRYQRTVAPLFLMAALLEPTGLFVAIDEWFNNGSDFHLAALFVFGFMVIQQGFTLRVYPHSVLLFATVVFGSLSFATVFDWLEINENIIVAVMGTSLMCIAYAISKTPYAKMSGFWYLVGSISLFCGAFDMLRHTPIELIYLALCGLMIYVSVAVTSTALLFVSVIAMLCYIGYFTDEHFVNSIGWPAAMMLFGLILFAISSGALRIKKKYMQ